MNDWGDDDPDGPLAQDLVDDGDDAVPCPACGGDVYEDADQCPHCGEWIIPQATGARGRHWVWIVAALLAAGAMTAMAIL